MSTDIAIYIAFAILLGLPFEAFVMYKRGARALFALPRSRVAVAMHHSIVIATLVASFGVLAFGGPWHYLMPWCLLLYSIYFWIRGAYLLSRPSASAALPKSVV